VTERSVDIIFFIAGMLLGWILWSWLRSRFDLGIETFILGTCALAGVILMFWGHP